MNQKNGVTNPSESLTKSKQTDYCPKDRNRALGGFKTGRMYTGIRAARLVKKENGKGTGSESLTWKGDCAKGKKAVGRVYSRR